MDDLISRQTVIDKLKERLIETALNSVGIRKNVDETLIDVADEWIERWIDEVPSAQPERPKGHWIVWGGMDIPENHGRHICSLCGEFAPVRYEKPLVKEYLSDFCPNCGADMRGTEDG